MSSSVDLSPQTNSNEILTIENIISNLSNLLDCLPEVQLSMECSSSNNGIDDTMHYQFEKLLLQKTKKIENLPGDFNQIKEAFKTLKKFEDDAGGPIKKLERCLDEISKVVAEAPNDFFPIKKVQANYQKKEVQTNYQKKEVQAMLSALKDDAMKLKLSMWRHRMSSTSSDVHRYSGLRDGSASEVDELRSLHESHKFLRSSVFTEFQKVFKDLDTRLKLCVLSFAVLPLNTIVKRRLLINWWVGELLVDPPATGETAEKIVDDILTELKLRAFIEEVKERHKRVVDRFKMQPLVHRMVIVLAGEARLLDDDSRGNRTVKSSVCNRACLVKAEDGTSELASNLDLGKLQTIFNVNEPFPDLRFEWSAKMKKVNIVEWFSKMKNLSVLYLGRWHSSDQHNIELQSSDQHHKVRQGSLKNHIEVESTEFLKGLKNMNRLRLLSLQGISRINELPNSICKLTNLKILDLKACHNLEALPDGIASLKKLSHLDISGCYLLDDMPKGLASLTELQVLKGFVGGNLESDRDNKGQQILGGLCFPKKKDSCTIEDLIGLKKLSKLSINTRSDTFPTERELNALRKLEALQKLAIAWNYNSTEQEKDALEQEKDALNLVSTMNPDSRNKDSGEEKPRAPRRAPSRLLSSKLRMSKLIMKGDPEMPELFKKMEKLELQCFPRIEAPDWLISGNLKSLKKLYIRGGKLKNFRQKQGVNDTWTVEILRLKYLCEFNMDLNELQTSFPDLSFLEKVECPGCKWSVPEALSNVSNTL